MDKVFITGFTGQVGSQLAEFLLENTDLEIIGLMRWQEDQDNLSNMILKINRRERIFIEYGDLNDLSSLSKIINKWKPNYVFHLGAQSYPKTSFDIPIETLQTNIIGTANLLESIRNIRTADYNPTIHICSSSEVYGKTSSKVVNIIRGKLIRIPSKF